MIIAIDGPAGAGKSTIAKMLAKRLGFRYLDTGAMYRALTWKAMQAGINLDDEHALCRLLDQCTFNFRYENSGFSIFVDGINITEKIRQPSVTNNVHYVSNKQGVRQRMVRLQQEFASGENIVAEGRDMGTVVFPHAEKKFFLDAEISERARRRYAEFYSSNRDVSYADVIKDMEIRDRRDSLRNNAPLRKGEDAVYINTTGLTPEEVLNVMLKEIEPALHK